MMISAFGGVINAPDQCGRSRRRQAKLRPFMTRQYVSVRVCIPEAGGDPTLERDPEDAKDAYQDILHASARHPQCVQRCARTTSSDVASAKRSISELRTAMTESTNVDPSPSRST